MTSSLTFQCCLCGATVDQTDSAAVQFYILNAWREDNRGQALYAHSDCAVKTIRDDMYFDPKFLRDLD